jgi:hypothetical protein
VSVAGCETEFDTMLRCVLGAEVTCDANGNTFIPTCNVQSESYSVCVERKERDAGEPPDASGAECQGPAFQVPIARSDAVSMWTDAERRQFCDASDEYLLTDPKVNELLCYVIGDLRHECATYVTACPARAPGFGAQCFGSGVSQCTATATELRACIEADARWLRCGPRSCELGPRGGSLSSEYMLTANVPECRTQVLADCGFSPMALVR